MSRWLADSAERTPDAIAVEDVGGRVTYSELDAAVSGRAAWLRTQGVGALDRVTMSMPAGLELIQLLHALWRVGACAVPLNRRLTDTEQRQQRDRVGARLHLDAGTAGISQEEEERHPFLDRSSPAVILFTSGTSGAAKAAVLTAGNLDASARASRERLRTDASDRWLLCLPLFHVGGLSIIVRAALDGAAVVVHPQFDVAAVDRAIEEEAVSRVSLVPTTLKRLLDARGEKPPPQSLRTILLGGAAADEGLLKRAARLGFPVLATYGLTEASSQAATAAPEEPADGCVGRALPGSRIQVVNGSGRACAAGEEGEIELKGPTVFSGYLGDRASTEDAFRDGWFRTGDIGRIESGGRLRVLDRRTNLVISGGENVYPAEVEAVLLGHAAVAEVAVWRRADPDLGHRVVAWVVASDPGKEDGETLQAFCRTSLAGYKVPREIVFVTELPRNAMGKIVRSALE